MVLFSKSMSYSAFSDSDDIRGSRIEKNGGGVKQTDLEQTPTHIWKPFQFGIAFDGYVPCTLTFVKRGEVKR
jgi:hypothetical protein